MDDFWTQLFSVLASTVRLSTPLVLAAMGGILAERSGTVDIGLEAKMLVSAFVAAAVASISGSVWVGLLAGMGASVVFALLHGVATIHYKGDHVVSGVALNFLAAGLTVVLGQAWFDMGGQTPELQGAQRFAPVVLPGVDFLREHVPLLGQFYGTVISGQAILVYLAFVAVVVVHVLLMHTRLGLRIRAVGDEPNAVDTAGISVARLRYLALIGTGLLCGMAGAYLSTAQNASFSKDMSAGAGYIALAAVIFGKWRPWPVLGACLLFGFLTAMQARLQGVEIPGIGPVPTQVFQALPYILTVILLAGFIGKAVAPKAIGRPYLKER